MIYIEKEDIPREIEQKIIAIRKDEKWKNIADDDTDSIREVFDSDFPKSEIKELLIKEQRGLCAYCMRRISPDIHSRIEHWMPLSKNKEKAIDYTNMLGVCDGGEKIISQQEHILCCDAHKKEDEITTSPLNKAQMDKIAYKFDGTIYTDPRDEDMEYDINKVLLLNGIQKPDGSVRDTSTELLKGRRDAYANAKRMMIALNKKGKCTSSHLRKIMDTMRKQEQYEEYVGVKLYYLEKKHVSMLHRGL